MDWAQCMVWMLVGYALTTSGLLCRYQGRWIRICHSLGLPSRSKVRDVLNEMSRLKEG